VPPGAHWPQEKGLTSNEQILGFLDVRDVVSSFITGEQQLTPCRYTEHGFSLFGKGGGGAYSFLKFR
jgi:hypothetical protein